jgi:uncharacterized protein (TIGR04551 family)
MKRSMVVVLALLVPSVPGTAGATGFTDYTSEYPVLDKMTFNVNGYFRMRGELFYDLDLSRGPTPSGATFFPVPLSDRTSHLLTNADMRWRLDVAISAPYSYLSVKARIDVLDNVALGSNSADPPGNTTQAPPANAIRVKRVWAEALTPLGVIGVGRIGAQWGLGMMANGGDCLDCDSGDANDGALFATLVHGNLIGIAYNFGAAGPTYPRVGNRNGISTRVVDLEPSTNVRSLMFAFLRWHSDISLKRRRDAGLTTIDFGLNGAYRWQQNAVPATYIETEGQEIDLTSGQVVPVGMSLGGGDLWFRLITPKLRVELEFALLGGTYDNWVPFPGVTARYPAKALQYGGALESEYGTAESRWGFGLDMGLASGDPAPGFGAFPLPPKLGKPLPQAGDLEGLQAMPPYDNRLDNFRFHPDYIIDRILWREIIGTVTDAFYLRPHVRVRLLKIGPGTLMGSVAAIASWAMEATTPPGGERALGLELDPTLTYQARDGFGAALEYGLLIPFSGLNNVEMNLSAKPAQLLRLRLSFVY